MSRRLPGGDNWDNAHLAEVASPVNLKSWTVKVNGNERADLGIRWSGGALRVSGGGLRIIFR